MLKQASPLCSKKKYGYREEEKNQFVFPKISEYFFTIFSPEKREKGRIIIIIEKINAPLVAFFQVALVIQVNSCPCSDENHLE